MGLLRKAPLVGTVYTVVAQTNRKPETSLERDASRNQATSLCTRSFVLSNDVQIPYATGCIHRNIPGWYDSRDGCKCSPRTCGSFLSNARVFSQITHAYAQVEHGSNGQQKSGLFDFFVCVDVNSARTKKKRLEVMPQLVRQQHDDSKKRTSLLGKWLSCLVRKNGLYLLLVAGVRMLQQQKVPRVTYTDDVL